MDIELTPEQKEALANFNPNKPLVVTPAEIQLGELDGRFVLRRQTIADRLKISIMAAKLRENTELDAVHDNIAFILATFSVCCSEKPEGFVFEDLYELNPLFALYDKYVSWLNLFRLQLQASKKAFGAGSQ